MSGKWLAFIVFVYIIGMFLGATFEKHTTTTTWEGDTEVTTLQYLMNVSNMVQRTSVLGSSVPLPVPNGEYFNTMFKVLTLQFSFMTGEGYTMLYWILIMPIAILGVLCMVLLVYGVITGNLTWS